MKPITKFKTNHALKIFIIFALAISSLVITQYVDTIKTLYSRATARPANIIVHTSQVYTLTERPWNNFAQGGESPDYRFAPVHQQLVSLKPEYIRIDHLYDYYVNVTKNAQGNITYDWSKLDQTIRDITATGAKPFISLSYMPLAISTGDITDSPYNLQEWQQVIQATIEHISGSKGLDLNDVYYEVWNEPDLFGNWRLSGPKNYLDLYRFAALGARAARDTNQYSFGGPATTDLYPNWVTQFIQYTRTHNLRLDFYSWHKYTERPDDYLEDLREFYRLTGYDPANRPLELIISEWGIDSQNNVAYDNQPSAAHALSVISLIAPHTDKLFTFEIQDGKDPQGQPYWGRWGLLTHQEFGSQPKPRYQVYHWLAQMGDFGVDLTGQGDFVKALASRAKDGSITLFLANYDPAGTHTENVPVRFTGLIPGTYRLTQQFLTQQPIRTNKTAENKEITHAILMPPNTVARLTLELTSN